MRFLPYSVARGMRKSSNECEACAIIRNGAGAGLVFITAGSTAGSPPLPPLPHNSSLLSLSHSLAGHYCSCMFCSFEAGRVAAKAIAPPPPSHSSPHSALLLSCKHIIFPVRLPCTFISALMIQDAFRSWRPNDQPLCRTLARLVAPPGTRLTLH